MRTNEEILTILLGRKSGVKDYVLPPPDHLTRPLSNGINIDFAYYSCVNGYISELLHSAYLRPHRTREAFIIHENSSSLLPTVAFLTLEQVEKMRQHHNVHIKPQERLFIPRRIPS